MKNSMLTSGPSREEIIMNTAPRVSNNNNLEAKSHAIVDGRTTCNSLEYFTVHLNNHVYMPRQTKSRLFKLFNCQISRCLRFAANVVISV